MHCITQVLIIHYKRFKPVQQGDRFLNIKLRHPVEAKTELCINGQKYDLVGVLVHQGESANSGHYYFDTVCPPYTATQRAYRSNNDDRPELISIETLIDDVNDAYMLAYQKAAEPAAVSAERMPLPQKVEEVANAASDTVTQVQSVSSTTAPSTSEVLPKEKAEEAHPAAAASIPSAPKGTQRDKAEEVATNSSNTVIHDETYFKNLLQKRNSILEVPKPDRSTQQRSEYVRVCEEIRKLKDGYPHISVKTAPKTNIEKKATYRQNKQNKEKEQKKDQARKATDEAKEKDRARKASDEAKEKDRARKATDEAKEKDRARKASDEAKEKTRARMATDEAKEKTRARMATDEAKAANLQQKTAKKAGMTVKAKDGMRTELIFSGKFGVELNSLGAMDKVSHLSSALTTVIIDINAQVCQDCGARHFAKETGTRMCCVGGKVTLPCFKKPADGLLQLLFKDDFKARTFRKFVRSFNNALCLSSLRFNERSFRSNYKPSVVIEGRVHQFFGPLLEKEHETPRFAQLWVHDPAMETTSRIANMSLPANISEAEAAAVREIIETLQV